MSRRALAEVASVESRLALADERIRALEALAARDRALLERAAGLLRDWRDDGARIVLAADRREAHSLAWDLAIRLGRGR